MRGTRVNTNCPATKGMAELNHHVRDEQKEVRDAISGEGHGLSEEDESKINEDGEDANCGRKELAQPLAVQQRPQQQPQGPVVCWERFLPLRSLKVLLVENDDSTRHLVSALLRNCSYEVSAVANGLEAWKILEVSTNHIDLVLTEVAVPCLSGIGLLGKITSHKNCMNIPVIMMSSNDSMGIVFKCLSKGAVDFLVKPIRKNELKNIWQHVWRKCHSSSGSGSESGIGTQKYSKSKSVEGSDNNTDSYDEDDNTSIGLNVRDGSDNGSGTQSSWTKRAVEVDSPQPMSPWDQLADPPDSTCAQVIHSRAEAFSNNWVPIAATRECHGKDDELDNVAMGKDLEIGVPRNPDIQFQDQSKKASTALLGANKEKLESRKDGWKLEKGKLEPNSGTRYVELMKEVDLPVAITNCTNPQMESVAIEVPNEISKTNIKDKAIYDTKEIPSLELSLKRVRDTEEIGTSAQERNVLRHSDLSAFTRYNTKIANQTPTGNVGSCSPVNNSSEAAKTESMQNPQSNSNGTPNQCTNGSSNNNNDMGSTTKNAFTNNTTIANQTPTGNVGSCSPVNNSSEAAKTESMQNRQSNSNGTPNQHSNGSSNSNNMGSTTKNAFTNNTTIANQTPTANVGSCSPVNNSSEAAKTESMQNPQSNSNGMPNQRSNGSSNNNDLDSTTNNAFTKPAAFSDKPMLKSAVNIHRCSAFQPVQNSHGMPDDAIVNSVLAQGRDAQPQVQVQHHHHHYHHYHHHVHQQQQNTKHDDSSLRKMGNGPSNVLGTPLEGNAANYSLNGSASGSNNGSNGQNGSSTAVVNEGTNMASDNGVAEKGGAGGGGGGGSGSGSRSGADQNRFTQREAALNKFRQKRKDRCFEKKVRYQSRKRLAEQRPRVRGQFVRQVVYENGSKDKDC